MKLDRDGARLGLPAAQGRGRVNRLPIRVRLTAGVRAGDRRRARGRGGVRLRAAALGHERSMDGALQTRMTAAIALLAAAPRSASARRPARRARRRASRRCCGRTGGWRSRSARVHVPRAERLRAAAGDRAGASCVERRLPGIESTRADLAQPRRAAAGGSSSRSASRSTDRDEAPQRTGALVRRRRARSPSCSPRSSATRSPRPACGRSRRCAGARPRSRSARETERLPLPAARDEIRRLGETLNEMLDRLRRSFERERRFVADASHELRTPVAVIKTELEGVLRSGGLGARGARGAGRRGRGERPPRAAGRGPAGPRALGRGPAAGAARAAAPSAELLEGARHRFGDRAAERGRGDRGRGAGGARRHAPTSCACARRWRTWSTTRCATATGDIVLRARGPRRTASSSRSPMRARASAPRSPARAFERFTRASESRSGDGRRARPRDRARDRGGARRRRGDRRGARAGRPCA